MTIYISAHAAATADQPVGPRHAAPEPIVGKPRGWRYRGTHARRRVARRLLGDLVAWVLLVLVATAALVSFGPRVAAASAGPPDTAPRLTVLDGEHQGAMDAAEQWAAMIEAGDHAGRYDGWSAAARASVPREAYLAAQACAPPLADVDRIVNLRVDQVTVDGTAAVVWYWGESFHHIGPIRMRAATWHLYELMRFEDGVWRHEPAEHLLGTLVGQVTASTARCEGTRA